MAIDITKKGVTAILAHFDRLLVPRRHHRELAERIMEHPAAETIVRRICEMQSMWRENADGLVTRAINEVEAGIPNGAFLDKAAAFARDYRALVEKYGVRLEGIIGGCRADMHICSNDPDDGLQNVVALERFASVADGMSGNS